MPDMHDRYCSGFAVCAHAGRESYPPKEPLVLVSAPSANGWARVTPGEARQLAAILVEGADRSEGKLTEDEVAAVAAVAVDTADAERHRVIVLVSEALGISTQDDLDDLVESARRVRASQVNATADRDRARQLLDEAVAKARQLEGRVRTLEAALAQACNELDANRCDCKPGRLDKRHTEGCTLAERSARLRLVLRGEPSPELAKELGLG